MLGWPANLGGRSGLGFRENTTKCAVTLNSEQAIGLHRGNIQATRFAECLWLSFESFVQVSLTANPEDKSECVLGGHAAWLQTSKGPSIYSPRKRSSQKETSAQYGEGFPGHLSHGAARN